MAISSYSTTAASNTSISGINIAENCPPSGINNAIRQLMADVKTAAGDGSMIADDMVTTAKILDANVTTAKIADANVTAAKLATDAVETVKIKDAAVTGAKLGAITSLELLTALTNETGTGSAVFATSPTLTTPTLGVATATSINFGDEALSTYDEGTWTPVIAGTTDAGTGTHTTQTGTYTRIGKVVVIEGIIVWTNLVGATGTLRVNGLPFAAETANIPITVLPASLTVPAASMVAAMLSGSSINLYSTASGDISLLAIDTAGTLRFRGTYLTS